MDGTMPTIGATECLILLLVLAGVVLTVFILVWMVKKLRSGID